MPPLKRKLPNLGLQRRVRPRVEPEPESDVDGSDSEAPSEEDFASHGSGSDEEDGGESASGGSDEEEADSEEGGPALDASQLSFGALARAQASLQPRKKGSKRATEDEEDSESEQDTRSIKKQPTAAQLREKMKRTSKHAPVEMSSKKQVSRRRDFIEVPKREARDPRFMPLGPGGSSHPSKVDEIKARKAYAFIDDYQQDEINQLKAAIKKEKDPMAKEKLQKALISMESRMKAKKRKDRERELLEEHRKQEKELVKQGKQPFYLKKSEQKKKLLLDQFANMKKGQVDKAIERRRKKVAGKEKKALPLARRTAEDR